MVPEEKREAILEGRQIVRIQSGAVSGVAPALWNKRQRERAAGIKMRRARGSGRPMVKGRKSEGDEKQVGAERRMDSQSFHKAEFQWTHGNIRPRLSGVGNDHNGV